MIKSRLSICLILVFSMLFSFTVFAEDEVLLPTVSISADQTNITGSGTINLQIAVSNVTADLIQSGTIVLNKEDNALLTFGNITTDATDIVWTNDASTYSFTIETPRAFQEGEVIAKIPVTIGTVTQAEALTIGNIVTVTMKNADDADVTYTPNPGDVTVNVSPAPPAVTNGKITLVSAISSTDDITVTLKAGDTEVATTLQLSEDKKAISVTPSSALTDGTEYTVNVTGKGYTTSSSTKFTPNGGSYTFNVTDFLPGNFDSNNIINFNDFVLVSLAYYNHKTYSDETSKFDVNRDKILDVNDVNATMLSWKIGGLK